MNTLMRSASVVIAHVRGQHSLEMALAKDQNLVETLLSNGANSPLRESVGIWCSNWRANDRDILGREHCVERRRKLRVAIVDQEADGHGSVLDVPTEVTRLLFH